MSDHNTRKRGVRQPFTWVAILRADKIIDDKIVEGGLILAESEKSAIQLVTIHVSKGHTEINMEQLEIVVRPF